MKTAVFIIFFLAGIVYAETWTGSQERDAESGKSLFSSSELIVPLGKKAVITSIKNTGDAGFYIVDDERGWTVFRTEDNTVDYTGLVLKNGKYRIYPKLHKTEEKAVVEVDYELK